MPPSVRPSRAATASTNTGSTSAPPAAKANGRPASDSDEERGFHRAEHLQQIPEFTRTHQLVHPYRSDAESGNAQLDASLWNGRLISYGVEAQQLLTFGFAFAQNSTSRALHEEGASLLTPAA
ncbi:hypothetical protein AB0H18_03265 [Streptomyces sp. NPDC020766]|uniref:hypothetical protein n=1 Tax=Streptomyces sp. NPDC020766 TaxID=3155011 RepID=UPI0033F8054B